MEQIKAISLWQPFASLVVGGFKRYETRSWFPHYRGLLAIHATKKFPVHAQRLCGVEPFKSWLLAMGYEDYGDLPTGAVLGVVKLELVYGTEIIRGYLEAAELAMGDFSDKRFAWLLTDPQRFAEPIPARGKQGLWTWGAEVVETDRGLVITAELI